MSESSTTTKRRLSGSRPKKLVPIVRKATFVGQLDLAPNATGTKMLGSLNPVTRTQLNSPTQIRGGPTIYFKPVSIMAKYAVASTRLARALGMESITSHNAFAHINGQDGVVSGQVPGVPVRAMEYDKETQIPDRYNSNPGGPPTQVDIANWLASEGSKIVQKDGKYFELTAYVFNPVDFKDPRVQKGMSDLQIFDAISGQTDRHGGNIYIDPQTGQVTGIDDDQSMRDSLYQVDESHGKYPGLPPLVDRKTAEKILALSPEYLRKSLEHRENDQKDLSPEELQAAVKRLSAVQVYLKKLQTTGGIVDTWNGGTFAKLMANPDETYLGRAQTDLQDALAHKPLDGTPTKAGAPLVPPPALPVATTTVTSTQPQPTVQPSPPLSTRPTGASASASRPTGGGANVLTSPRLPTIAQTRPRTGGRRLGDEQPADQPGEHPDDQQLIAQQFIDQLDEPPSLATTTKGWGASPSSSSAHAATSRLASARLRPRVVEKEVVEKEKEKEKEVLPEPDITITENDDPTQRGATIVSPPRPVAPTDVQPTDVQPTGVQPTGAEPTDAEKRAKVLDVQAQIKRLNALLLDLTGGSADQ